MSSILDFATFGGVVRLIPSAQTNLVWIGAFRPTSVSTWEWVDCYAWDYSCWLQEEPSGYGNCANISGVLLS